MKIDTLKELEAVVKMCNKHGVRSITVDGIVMQLDGPQESKETFKETATDMAQQYSDEDLLFWSAATPGAE